MSGVCITVSALSQKCAAIYHDTIQLDMDLLFMNTRPATQGIILSSGAKKEQACGRKNVDRYPVVWSVEGSQQSGPNDKFGKESPFIKRLTHEHQKFQSQS